MAEVIKNQQTWSLVHHLGVRKNPGWVAIIITKSAAWMCFILKIAKNLTYNKKKKKSHQAPDENALFFSSSAGGRDAASVEAGKWVLKQALRALDGDVFPNP